MPKVDIVDMTGKKTGNIELAETVFGIEPNKVAMHTVVVNYLANQRQGTQSTKTRAEVRGGGAKPWRQKGTGRARHGSIRSPIWTGGGVTFGPKPRSYRFHVPRKTRRLALKSALSSKAASGDVIVVDDLTLGEIKTKKMVEALSALGAENKAILVMDQKDENVVKSSRNIPGVRTTLVNTLNVYDILDADKFIVSKSAVEKIQEVYK